jgi:Uncharacterized protein conserved in bacteria (DUF2171)
MSNWNQHDVRTHMQVFSSDNQKLGHVAEVYEDSFLVRKGFLFTSDRYIPYEAIRNIENEHIQLVMSAEDALTREWKIRPDYENHPGDPLQHLYDRGHGIHDPFDETNPNDG